MSGVFGDISWVTRGYQNSRELDEIYSKQSEIYSQSIAVKKSRGMIVIGQAIKLDQHSLREIMLFQKREWSRIGEV